MVLSVRVVSPKGLIYTSIANSVSSLNSAGKFDILPGHANFISFIENQPILIKDTDGKQTSLRYPFAIVYVVNNQVNIYTEIHNLLIES